MAQDNYTLKGSILTECATKIHDHLMQHIKVSKEKKGLLAILLLCFSCTPPQTHDIAPDFKIGSTEKYISSSTFLPEEANKIIVKRIEQGIYDGYTVNLCRDDLTRCKTAELSRYTDKNPLILSAKDWTTYSDLLKKEILNGIAYSTWGHDKNIESPLVVTFTDQKNPLDYLNPISKSLWMKFPEASYLKGGKGKNAYAPNCWYSSISAISADNSDYARKIHLQSTDWDHPRFMGPSEFRCFMHKFEKTDKPKFGDIVRYYTDSIYYDENINLYNGEVHAAIYIGYNSLTQTEIVLTKNGRRDLDFLIYQDIKELDKLYTPQEQKDDPRIKAYYRLKTGSTMNDPAICGKCSDCYDGYKTDSINYINRWLCLAEKATPPDSCAEENPCYCHPKKWKTYY